MTIDQIERSIDFRFPLYHLGIRGCLAPRQYLLDDLA